MEIAEPKCPDCKTIGADKIFMTPGTTRLKSSGQPYFQICHCGDCGHVYEIISGVHTGSTIDFKMPKPF